MSFLQQLEVVAANWDAFLHGILLTMYFSVIGMAGGLVLGVIGSFMRTSSNRILSSLAVLYVGLFRNTPLLVQLYLFYFGLPGLGLPLGAWTAGYVALIINNGAYITEIVRGGMRGVPETEVEAGFALALSRWQVAWNVTIPRILRIVFPSLSNQFILIVISSSLLGLIGIPELFQTATSLEAETFASIGIYVATAALYIVVTLLLSFLLHQLARQLLSLGEGEA